MLEDASHVIGFQAALSIAVFEPRGTNSLTRRRWQGSGIYRCGACPPDHNGVRPPVGVTKSRQGINVYRCVPGRHNRRYQRVLDDYIDSLVLERLTGPAAGALIDHDIAARLSDLMGRRGRRAWSGSDDSLARTATDPAHPSKNQHHFGCEDPAVLDAAIDEIVRRDPVTALVHTGVAVEYWWRRIDPQWRTAIIDSLMRVTILPLDYHRQTRELDIKLIAVDWRR